MTVEELIEELRLMPGQAEVTSGEGSIGIQQVRLLEGVIVYLELEES